MHFVPLADIIIPPNRIRRDFNPQSLADLEESINAQGLFHPILTRSDGRTLVAGERRVRVLRKIAADGKDVLFDGAVIPQGTIPAVGLGERDGASLLEAELHENTRRHQLTWQEQALATEALHKLRAAQNGGVQTIQATAGEIGGAKTVSDDLLVAPWLDDEEVASAPNRKEALRIIERRLTHEHRKVLARTFGERAEGSSGECFLGTMQDVLPRLDSGIFDCVIADPPYGIGADNFANQSAVQHSYEDSQDSSTTIYTFLAGELIRLTKDQAHVYLFCDTRRFESLTSLFTARGWRVWPWPLIWHRGTSNGLLPWPEHGPRRTYEGILFAIKGNRRITGIFPDVINVPHERAVERAAHKPPALYADLINRSCLPGNRVLDPCCGTGPIFPAARLTNTYAVGVELEEAAYAQALERMKGDDSTLQGSGKSLDTLGIEI